MSHVGRLLGKVVFLTTLLLLALPAAAAAPVRSAAPRADTAKAAPAARGGEPQDPIFANGFEPASVDIATATPPNGSSLAADALPLISVRFAAPGSTPAIQLLLDGVDLTAQAQLDAGLIRYTPAQALREGRHEVSVRVNGTSASWSFTTATPPRIFAIYPDQLQLASGARPEIRARYSDIGAGIAAASVSLSVDGNDVTAQATVSAAALSFRPAAALANGSHYVVLSVADLAGNRSEAQWRFALGQSPQIVDLAPPDLHTASAGSVTQISAAFSSPDAPLDAAAVRLLVNSDDVSAQAVVTLDNPHQGRIVYTPAAPLPVGRYDVFVEAMNQARQFASAQWAFTLEPALAYELQIIAPAPDAVVRDERIVVRALVRSTRERPVSVSVDAQPAYYQGDLDGGAVYEAPLTLRPGANSISVVATFRDGQSRSATRVVNYDAPPQISLTSPRDWQAFGPVTPGNGTPVPGGSINLSGAVERPIAIAGSVSRPVVGVSVNQQQAQLDAGGTRFSFERFFLHEGTNLLSVNALDEHGRVGTAQLTVYVDQTAPLISIEGPAEDAVTSAARIDVRGVVNDAVEAGVSAAEPRVGVVNAANGQQVAAVTSDRYYLARAVPLEVGANRLTVTATDAQGNARAKSVQVTRTAAGSRRITLLSGDRQSAPIAAELARPLAVAAIDSDGLPLVDLPVRFDLLRGSGSISAGQGQPVRPDGVHPARSLIVNTDDSGRAQVWLRVGTEAAESGNMLRAWSEQIAEDVVFTATGQRGPPRYVLANGAAGSQYAQTDSQPLEALTVRVQDAEFNPIPGARLRYRIVRGDARFDAAAANGGTVSADGSEFVVNADKDGLATARPLLGSRPGTVRVEAVALLDGGGEVGPAALHILVLQRQAGPTRFGGIVLDHIGTPLRGVRLSIARTNLSTLSDADGKFQFDDQVPPGKIDLFVDGRDVHLRRGGQTLEYPALHFETAVIQGQLNQLPHPIYLPPIDLGRAQLVGGDQDVSLGVPGYEGFKMVVKARSVTFPDGSHEGLLVVTPVSADRLPMVPPGPSGSFGTLAWTVQPTGTRFDPPVEVHIPNSAGMLPGETLAIVQWDHDLATFVPMGRGTVDESGTTIVSDRDSGITKAGWGGGPPPVPPNCGDNPPPDMCPADLPGSELKALTAECSRCGACKKEQPSAPGTCASSCVPKVESEIRFTVDKPARNAEVTIETGTAEPERKLFDIKVSGLDDDDSKTWAFKASKKISFGGRDPSEVTCEASSDAKPFSGATTEAKIKDVTFKSGGDSAKIKMVTTDSAELTIKGCALKEEKQTFKTKMLNPAPDEVKAYAREIETDVHAGTALPPGSDIPIAETLIRFMCKEPAARWGGKYKQFKVNGMPILNGTAADNGGDGGVGVMQVTDKAQRTCSAIWDWRGNIAAGKEIFRGKRREVDKHHLREYGRDNPLLKECVDLLQDRPPLPPLSGLQHLYESIRLNNGGRQHRWVPSKPFVACNIGEWQRYLSQDNPPEPEYVEHVCKCDGDLVPAGCLAENDAIFTISASPLRFRHVLPPLSSESEVYFTTQDNELNVEFYGSCEIQPADAGDPADVDYFSITQNIPPLSLPKNTRSPTIKVSYIPAGVPTARLATLACGVRPPGRPSEVRIPLRVLPPSYASRPAAGATLALTATGTATLVVVNDYRAPVFNNTIVDAAGQPLTVSLDGLSAPLGVTPQSASISSNKNQNQNEKEFTIACQNTTNQVVTQTLVVNQDGVLPGPLGPVSYTVTCAAAQP